jgi:hypothetical protein
LQKRADERLKPFVIRGCGEQYTNSPYALALLRARGKRPRCHRSTQKCDELAPSHWPVWAEDDPPFFA